MAEHAKKSLSASPRWSRCSGSIREELKYPNTSGSAAIDGTGSHVLLELILKGDIREVRGGRFAKTTSYLGETIGLGHKGRVEGWVVDAERLARVMIAVNYVQQRLDQWGSDVMLEVESKTDPGVKYGINDMWGTVDITLIGGSVLEVIDYKDGRTYVSENTEQLLAYADGQIEYARQQFFNIKTVVKTIIQPRIVDQMIRSVTHSREQNDEMAEKLADAAKLTDDPNALLTSGDHCTWCKHKPNCEARNQIAVNAINGLVEPVKMTNEQLAEANDAVPMINSFVESLKSEAEKRIKEGQVIPGYEIVPGRKKNKVWVDENAAKEKLRIMTVNGKRLKRTEYVLEKLISPSAVLKFDLLKRQRVLIESLLASENGNAVLRKVVKNQIPDEEMFPEELFVEELLTPEKENLETTEERIKGELEDIFHPEKKTKERVIIMTEKAEGWTAADFKKRSVDWTDDLLIKEGYAIWSES